MDDQQALLPPGAGPAVALASMIASVVAYFEFGSVFGFTPMFDRGSARYRLGHPGYLVLFALVGVLAGLLGRAYAWSFYRTMTCQFRG